MRLPVVTAVLATMMIASASVQAAPKKLLVVTVTKGFRHKSIPVAEAVLEELAARELLKLDVKNTFLIVEHEYPKARIQDKQKLAPILQGSIAFTRKIDEAAACMFALQSGVLKSQGIPVQGRGREAYRS